jgi:hypothetical protein
MEIIGEDKNLEAVIVEGKAIETKIDKEVIKISIIAIKEAAIISHDTIEAEVVEETITIITRVDKESIDIKGNHPI